MNTFAIAKKRGSTYDGCSVVTIAYLANALRVSQAHLHTPFAHKRKHAMDCVKLSETLVLALTYS